MAERERAGSSADLVDLRERERRWTFGTLQVLAPDRD
jgi:hypothetical protein